MNFGQNIQTWLAGNLGPIFLMAIGCMAVYYLFKREMGKFIGFVITAAIVAVFVFAPEFVKDWGISVVKYIFTWE